MDKNRLTKAMQWLVVAGLLLVMAGTVMPLFRVETGCWRWLYTAGAVAVLVGQLFSPYSGDNLRLKRLYRIETWSGVLFCAGAFFIFYRSYGVGPMDWIAFTLAGGIIRIYTSIMIPRAASRK